MLKFPKYALDCISVLLNSGYKAYFVGGCVRDGLLNRPCFDIDITTSALPEEIIHLFPTSIPTGISHGTVTVLQDGNPIEITTYRKEEGYQDKRHPDKVSFVSSLEEDLSRRDFTINALACSVDGKITDLFGGLRDLENKIIRTVGNAEARFNEDALRILRAYRFASTLNFAIEESTALAANKLAHNIKNISGERILKEISKSANGYKPSSLSELINSGALEEFGIEATPDNLLLLDNIKSLNLTEEYTSALFLFLHKHNTLKFKKNLKAGNFLINCIQKLDELSASNPPENKYELKIFLFNYGPEFTEFYLKYLSLTNTSVAAMMLELFKQIIKDKEVFTINQLAVTGNDLMGLGFSGRDIGIKLNEALYYVMENNARNNKEEILKHLKTKHQY